jgi:hypothetical protein
MKFTGYLFIVFIAVACFDCGNPQTRHNQLEDTIKLFHQLTGTWKMDGKEVYEQWTYKDKVFSGKVYQIEGADTLVTETLELVMPGDSVYLRALVPNQNQSKPVDFIMVEITEKRGVFVNPGHDFPTTISYELTADDRLEAWIEGRVEGEDRKIKFHYTRQ